MCHYFVVTFELDDVDFQMFSPNVYEYMD